MTEYQILLINRLYSAGELAMKSPSRFAVRGMGRFLSTKKTKIDFLPISHYLSLKSRAILGDAFESNAVTRTLPSVLTILRGSRNSQISDGVIQGVSRFDVIASTLVSGGESEYYPMHVNHAPFISKKSIPSGVKTLCRSTPASVPLMRNQSFIVPFVNDRKLPLRKRNKPRSFIRRAGILCKQVHGRTSKCDTACPNYTDLNNYQILLINNGLMFSTMTRAQAKAYIDSHPDFLFKDAAL